MSNVFDSPRRYEREAVETRRRLSSTLDELTSSLTPGRVLDEVMSFSRAGGGDVLRGLGGAASANPIPTLLVGAGLAMFLSGRGGTISRTGNGFVAVDGVPGRADGREAGAPVTGGVADKVKSAFRSVEEQAALVAAGAAASAEGLRAGAA